MEQHLEPFVQPIVDPFGNLYSYEILMRFKGSSMLPGPIIQRWENSGFIAVADLSMLKRVNDVFQTVQNRYRICVNISIRSIENAADSILAKLIEIKKKVRTLIVELTETAAVIDASTLLKFVARCKMHFIAISLDDCRPDNAFGSKSLIRLISPHFVKIDGQFLHECFATQNTDALDEIIYTSKEIGAKVIAEYIDSDEIKLFALSFNVDYLQGFLIGKPAPVSRIKLPVAADEKIMI